MVKWVRLARGLGRRACFVDGNPVIEEDNGSGEALKDHVWGLTYVAEAAETRINTNPTGTASWSNYFHLQHANFNDLGLVQNGVIQEWYTYSAYGERLTFGQRGGSRRAGTAAKCSTLPSKNPSYTESNAAGAFVLCSARRCEGGKP